jgi:hypothetical protein
MAFWITCHMKAKREQKKAEQIVIKLFSRNYARDLLTKYDINNLIVVGIVKVGEYSRLTFTKRIKNVFQVSP